MIRSTHKRITAILFFLIFSSVATAQVADSYLYLIPDNKLTDSKDLSDFSVSYLGDSSNVSIMNFAGNYDREINGSLNIEARQAVLHEFYRVQPDQYDFLVIFTKFPVDSGEAAAFAITYKNDVQGIGTPIFDTSLVMGSERIQTTIDMTEISDWELNPGNREFDSTLGILIHEMMHRWGIRVNFEDENNQISDLLRGRDDSHWNYFLNSNASVMYGSLWDDLGSGQFETQSIRKSLSPLDLYLMGFKESASVPDFFLISEGVPGNRIDVPSPIGTQVTGNRVDITIDSIIAAEGPRVPAVADAQHEFNFKFIILKHDTQQIYQSDIGKLLVLQREFQKRFFVETSGLGEITYNNTVGTNVYLNPIELEFDPVNNTTVNLDDAKAFLLDKQQVPQGYWADKAATKVRDTAMAVKALQLLDEPEAFNLGANWLNEYEAMSNDELAWQLLSEVLTSEKQEAMVDRLLNNINSDGGWGLSTDSESSLYDTALVLRALTSSDLIGYTPSSNTLLYIADQFNADNGVGYTSGGISSLSSSVMLLHSFYHLTSDHAVEQDLIDYIINLQLTDGGFGENNPTVHETAQAIEALRSANSQNNTQDVDEAITELLTLQSIDGTFEGSIYSTALAAMVLLNDNRQNFKFIMTKVSNNVPVAGEIVTVDFKVQLLGDQVLENLEVAVYQQNNLINSVVIPVLNPDENLNSFITIDTTSLVGDYNLSLKLDPNNDFIESNELDNKFDFSLNVTEQSSTPELAFIYPSINYTPQTIDQLPEMFELVFDVINLSTVAVQDVEISLFKKIDSGTMDMLSTQIIDINSNQVVNVQFNEQITEGFIDSYEFIIFIDKNNQVVEVNEFNNKHIIKMNKELILDLEILSSDINAPSSIYVGQPATFEYLVKNTGTVVSPTFDVTVIVDDGNSVEPIFTESISPIEPGASKNLLFEVLFDRIGTQEVQIVVDQSNLISESNESNNTGIVTADVQENNLTNLSLQGSEIQFSINPGLEGKSATFSVLVSNTSSVSGGAFDLSLFAQMPNESPVELVTINGLAEISGGTSRTEEITVSELDFSGQVLIIASVDPSQMIDEFDETDNITFIEYSVLAKADAVVSPGGISLDPSVPVIDELLSVDVSVSNSGEQDIASIKADLYSINSSTQVSTLVATETLTSLLAGESSVFAFNFTFPNDTGIDQLKVVVDEDDLIPESREDNNSAAVIIGQQNNDFYLNTQHFSPNGDGHKDSVQIVFNLDEVDNYQISIRNSLNQLVRQFDYSQFSQTLFGDVKWEGRGANGKILPDGQYSIHVMGENSYYENELIAWLDTNRYSMAETLKNDSGILFDLNCLVNEVYDSGTFSLDGKYMYVYSYQDNASQTKYGIYRIKTDGTEIKPMLPNSFTNSKRVNELYLSTVGSLIFSSTNSSNLDELWSLNPNTQGLTQLLTTGVNDFDVFDFTDDYLTIRYYENSQYNFEHISLNPITPPELIEILPTVQNHNDLKRVSNGWVWLVWDSNTDIYNVYFKADTGNTSSVLLDSIANQNNLKISNDKTHFLIEDETSVQLYRLSSGFAIATQLEESRGLYGTFNSFFSTKNDVVSVTDKIRVFDHFGSEILQVNHKYNYDYFVQQIIDQYGSIDNLTYSSESGLLIYSLEDVEDLRIEIESLRYAWASSEELYIGFSANLTGRLFVPVYGSYQNVTIYLDSDISENKRINYSDISNINVFDLTSTGVSSATFSEPLSNYFSMGSSVYGKNSNDEPIRYQSKLLDDYNLISFSPEKHSSSIIDKILVKNYNSNNANTCTPVFGNERAFFQSKQNLTTFISAKYIDGAVEITGSVFDQFLAQYIVEWKRNDQANSNWNFLMSGQSNQVNELFNHWIPPEPGIYTLRLSAYDRAENTVFDQVEVVVGALNANIKNVDISPRYISPNFDGIQDELYFEYDLIKPVNVNVEIKNSSGFVLKTIVRNYTLGMVSDQFSWDGRGDNGQVLPDGKYVVMLEGLKYPVTIDTKAPNVELLVSKVLADSCCFDLKINAQVKVKLPLDGNPDEFDELVTSIERYDLSTGQWRVLNENFVVNPNNFDTFQNLLLRGRATDYSGNFAYTQEVPVEINKAIPVDIRRIVNNGEEISVHKAALRDEGISIKSIVATEYPEITSSALSDYLGITIQAKTFQAIQSVEMKTSYLGILDGKEVEIENVVPLSLSDFALTETYFKNETYFHDDTLVQVIGDPKLFRLSNDEGNFYFNFLQIDQASFPVTNKKIKVELIITYADAVINHPFYITFQPQNVFLDFFQLSKRNPAYKGSELAPIAHELLSREMFGNEGTADLWLFSDNHVTLSDPIVTVYEKRGQQWVFIEEIELYYEDSSIEYVSQYFKFDKGCDEPKLQKYKYSGTDDNGDLVEIEIEFEPCQIGVSDYKIWYDAGAFCDNNAAVDPTLKVSFEDMYLEFSALEFPAYKLQVIIENNNGVSQIVYEENNPVPTVQGMYNLVYEINKANFNGGQYKFTVKYSQIVNLLEYEVEYYTYLNIENKKALSEISQPTAGQKLCAVNSEDGLYIPISFKSTLATDSPYQHSFAQITEGSFRPVEPAFDGLESVIDYEEENRFKFLNRTV